MINRTKIKHNKPELLAPAGCRESAYAAFQYGADAVYLGLKSFSARAEAVNFTLEELEELTAFAHSQAKQKKVYVAINTLVQEEELEQLIITLCKIRELDVDAIIVQDLGLAEIARRYFPELELHASTQLAIHNLEGAIAAKELGFSRVTLARELTLAEIEEITTQAGIDTEVFIHGALCYSYSGLCLFSSHLYQRSGNRGQCAYPCRELFTFNDSTTKRTTSGESVKGNCSALPFSMKDLALPELVSELCSASVSSLKIEGRMKSPLYTAVACDYYRSVIDQDADHNTIQKKALDLKTVFSRPWTELYLRSPQTGATVDSKVTGHRGAEIGIIEKVYNRKDQGRWIRFKTLRRLELHDGIQLELPGLIKPYGFSIRQMQIVQRGKISDVFEAECNSSVEILLPDDCGYIPEGAELFCSSSQEVKQRYQVSAPKPGMYRKRLPVALTLAITDHSVIASARLSKTFLHDITVKATVKREMDLSLAKDPSKTEIAARKAFSKLIETPFESHGFEYNNSHNRYLSAAELNSVRRELFSSLVEQIERSKEEFYLTLRNSVINNLPVAELENDRKSAWQLRIQSSRMIEAFRKEDLPENCEILLDLEDLSARDIDAELNVLTELTANENLRFILPPVVRSWDKKRLKSCLSKLIDRGYNKFLASNISSRAFVTSVAKDNSSLDISADSYLYVTNSYSANTLLRQGFTSVTLSTEDSINNKRKILTRYLNQAWVILHQDSSLFISETCPKKTVCNERCTAEYGKCQKIEQTKLISSRDKSFYLTRKSGRSITYHQTPYSLQPHLNKLICAGARRFRVDFINRDYSSDDVLKIFRDYLYSFQTFFENSGAKRMGDEGLEPSTR